MADNVNHPAHYETGKFECIDVMVETQGVEATQDFCVCNALKYVYRHKKKNGMEDLQKAIWYLNKAVELENEKKKEPPKESETRTWEWAKPYKPIWMDDSMRIGGFYR